MNWRAAVIEYIRENAKPVDKFDHQPRLYALACRVGEGEGIPYDDDVLFASVWMHDLGVFVGHRPDKLEELAQWDNTGYACRMSPGILEGFGFPVSKIPAVVEAIKTHQPHATPAAIEGVILRDADILEQLGAVAVVRAMAKIGRDTRFPTHHEVIPVLEKAVRELPNQLRLDAAKRLATPKIAALHDFLAALREEMQLPA